MIFKRNLTITSNKYSSLFLLRFTPKHFFPPSKVALIYFDTLWHNAKCKLEVWFLYLVFLCSANDLWSSSALRLMRITQKLSSGFALTLCIVLKLLLCKSRSMLRFINDKCEKSFWAIFLKIMLLLNMLLGRPTGS